MTQSEIAIIMLVVIVIGFGAGFVLRPVKVPLESTTFIPAPPIAQSREARGVQYFVTNAEEAHLVLQGCREASMRRSECANAEEAIIEVEAEEPRHRFLGQ